MKRRALLKNLGLGVPAAAMALFAGAQVDFNRRERIRLMPPRRDIRLGGYRFHFIEQREELPKMIHYKVGADFGCRGGALCVVGEDEKGLQWVMPS